MNDIEALKTIKRIIRQRFKTSHLELCGSEPVWLRLRDSIADKMAKEILTHFTPRRGRRDEEAKIIYECKTKPVKPA